MTDYRQEARGRHCTARLPCCNGDPATTVLAHLNGGGMGMKRNDKHGAWTCSACHDALDGRAPALDYSGDHFTASQLRLIHLEAVIRTQEILITEGKL